jgi:hypothetical protein
MATKVKIAKTEIVPMDSIVQAYSTLINHQGEIEFIIEIAEMLKSGKTSVRVVQESIATASAIGNAPTIRKSHVQWFTILSEMVGKIEDAQAQSVANLLKLAERVGRNHGAEGSQAVIESCKTTAELEAKSPTQAKARKNAKAEPKAKTIENIISQALLEVRTLKNLKELKTSDLQTLTALLEVLVPVAKRSMVKN